MIYIYEYCPVPNLSLHHQLSMSNKYHNIDITFMLVSSMQLIFTAWFEHLGTLLMDTGQSRKSVKITSHAQPSPLFYSKTLLITYIGHTNRMISFAFFLYLLSVLNLFFLNALFALKTFKNPNFLLIFSCFLVNKMIYSLNKKNH